MKIVIAIGMVVIFISAFFMFFIFDTVIKDQIACISSLDSTLCDMKQTSSFLMIGIALITLFLLIDGVVLYIVIKSITASTQAYIPFSSSV